IKPPDTSSTSIIYELEYMNWSGKAGDKLIKIYLEKKSEYYNIKSSFIDEYKLGSNRTLDKDYGYQIDNDKIKFSLPFGKNCKLKFDIEYFNEGENSIPAIFLDDVRFQDNSVKILVEDYLNAQTSVFYLIIINILMLCATLYINKINNDKSIRMLNEHKNAHLFQIDASANSIQKEIGQIKNNLSTLNDKMKRVDDLVYLKDIALEMKKINRKLK
ncbi:MAG: hypothetical protein PHF80_03790, partial [Methanothrix sp.]|nr:hypothetical protein [Methanothrix sp.]